MRSIRFTKMEGAGNDYVYVDAVNGQFCLDDGPRLAPIVADRHFGIGSDGLIVMAPSQIADVRMVMWNADGSRGRMCGNGLRCLAKLAYDTRVLRAQSGCVETDAGIRSVELQVDEVGDVASVRVDMGEVVVSPEPESVELLGQLWTFHPVDVGNPHAVIFCQGEAETWPVAAVGAGFQSLPRFEGGVNVEFVGVDADGALRQRTYERGSGETLACGSGAVAAAAAAMATLRAAGPRVMIHLAGGDLVVERQARTIVLEGPARSVYAGEFPLPKP